MLLKCLYTKVESVIRPSLRSDIQNWPHPRGVISIHRARPVLGWVADPRDVHTMGGPATHRLTISTCATVARCLSAIVWSLAVFAFPTFPVINQNTPWYARDSAVQLQNR